MIRTIIALATGLFLSVAIQAAPIPELHQLPKGSYLNDGQCRACFVDNDNQLVCSCHEANNTPGTQPREFRRTIDLSSCEEDYIEYRVGYLFCGKSQVTAEAGEPTGRSTLEDNTSPGEANDGAIKDEGKAVDDTESAPWKLSDIVGGPVADYPSGDYSQYCNSCKVQDGVLECECNPQDWSGSTIKATIPLDSCPKDSPITYHSGSLICQEDLVETLYLHKCRNCQVKDNRLTCECARTPCQWSQEDLDQGRDWHVSTLKEFRFCSLPITNCNGQLKCGGCNRYDYYEEFLRPYKGVAIKEYCRF